jgi:hypothetical protein
MDIFKEIISQHGPQWLGWFVAVSLIFHITRREKAITEIVKENTKALTHIKVLVEERLPKGGG